MWVDDADGEAVGAGQADFEAGGIGVEGELL